MFLFFQCWFLERHPWNKDSTLKFVSPCAYLTAFHIWFQARFNLRAVRWQILKYKRQLYRLLLWKSENVCHNLHALKRRQYALLQAILGCLNPPRLREVLDASIFLKYFHCFFAVPFPLFLLFFSILYFCLSFSSFCWWLLWQWTLGLTLYLIHGKILNIWLLRAST